jgi:hypothetical protein
MRQVQNKETGGMEMTKKNLDLMDIIEAHGYKNIEQLVYKNILPLYAAVLQRTDSEDHALHACSRYMQTHKELYQTWSKEYKTK